MHPNNFQCSLLSPRWDVPPLRGNNIASTMSRQDTPLWDPPLGGQTLLQEFLPPRDPVSQPRWGDFPHLETNANPTPEQGVGLEKFWCKVSFEWMKNYNGCNPIIEEGRVLSGSPICLVSGSSFSGREWILFSIDEPNWKLDLWIFFLLTLIKYEISISI